jgi:hypothetical protein
MVIVDSLDKDYDTPTKIPAQQASSPDSPFKGQTAARCFEMLQEMHPWSNTVAFTGELLFIIIDERSLVDDTVRIVQAVKETETGAEYEETVDGEGGDEGDEEFGVFSVRVAYDQAWGLLLAASVGDFDIEAVLEGLEGDEVIENDVLKDLL